MNTPDLIQLLDECEAAMRGSEAELRLLDLDATRDLAITLARLRSQIRTTIRELKEPK